MLFAKKNTSQIKITTKTFSSWFFSYCFVKRFLIHEKAFNNIIHRKGKKMFINVFSLIIDIYNHIS